ncbi:hypothetical protein ACT4ML_13225 [Natrinema sp. LN54]|uniref:hypothetical protein n=1 Tax=Natrinema sp. LN54 TaxID=3458705 RepID=UPI0040352521
MSVSNSDVDDRVFKVIGGGSAVMNAVAFTAVGMIALDSIVYGAIAGVFAGAGASLFLPWFLRFTAAQNEASEEGGVSDAASRAGGSARTGVVGLGLELGGIGMLAAGFALGEPDPVFGILVALAVAVVVSLAAAVVFD